MSRLTLFVFVVLSLACLSAGLLPVPGNGPCPGGTYPTIYLACYHSAQCPYRQYCFRNNPLINTGFCCPYPFKGY